MKKIISTSVWVVMTVVMVMVTFSSCDKDKEEVLPHFEALLTAHPWKLDNLEFVNTDPEYQDEADEAKADLTGKQITFSKDHNYIWSFSPDRKGTWKISEDGKKLTVDESSSNDGEIMDVPTLTESTLTLVQHDENFGDVTMNFIKD